MSSQKPLFCMIQLSLCVELREEKELFLFLGLLLLAKGKNQNKQANLRKYYDDFYLLKNHVHENKKDRDTY